MGDRFSTERERKHLREMFSQYEVAELRRIKKQIEQLISERLDSSTSQAQERSPIGSA